MKPRARKTPPRRKSKPLATTLERVGTALPPAPSDPKPTPTFLPSPSAAWRALRAAWIAKRGELPAQTLPGATFPATTVADVVEIANHVTAALRNDVARVDPVLGRRIWDRWRQSVERVRKRVARARDDAAPYADNETFWEDAILYIVFAMPGKPRNASPPTDTAPPRRRRAASVPAADGDDDRPSSSPPMIRAVEILYAENAAVPRQTFPSLWDADAALARAFRATPPPRGGGYDKVSFRVTWTDDETHDGRVDVSEQAIDQAQRHGGLLRRHLDDVGRWLAGDDHARMFAGRISGDELEHRRAWGAELLARLDRDARAHTNPGATRNATSPRYAGHGVPEPRESNRARAWLGAIPQPPTLLPEPNAAVTNLRAAFEASFRPGAVDWLDGRANVLVNYVTLALRHDLVALDAHDAAVIWMRWRDAIVDFVAHRAADYDVALRYRLDALAADLASARARPRSVYDSFCPWRAQYFDSDRLHPESIGHNPRRSPLEIHSWRS